MIYVMLKDQYGRLRIHRVILPATPDKVLLVEDFYEGVYYTFTGLTKDNKRRLIRAFFAGDRVFTKANN